MPSTFADAETELLRQMSPEQKLRTLDALRHSAALLVEAGVRARAPQLTAAEVQAEVRRLMTHDSA